MNLAFLLKHKKLIGFLVVLIILGLVFRGRIMGKIKPGPQYKTVKAEKTILTQIVSASGKIKSDEEATLKFQASGYLAWVGVKKGDKVKKWQAVASLDKEELQKQLKQELLDYMNERWDFAKDRHTYNISEDKLDKYTLEYDIRNLVDKTQFDLDRTVLDVEIKNLAIKYATLWSPIDGLVTAIDAPNAGVNITPTTATFTVSNPDKMIFSAKVDEADIGKVVKGQKTKIVLDAFPEQPLETVVEQIDFTSTTTTSGGTAYEVKFLLAGNEAEKFKIGMNGDVEIVIAEKPEALTVPFETIREKNGDQFVWVLVNGKPEQRKIKVGLGNDSQSEILEGLKGEELVIVSDFKTLDKLAK